MAYACQRTLSRISQIGSIFSRISHPNVVRATNAPICSKFYASDGRNKSMILRDRNYAANHHVVVVKRAFGGKPPYSIKTVTDRVMLVCQLYDKIKPEKMTLDSHFINDLGLDSLDHVEIMLQMEHEFTIEIPDADAEELMTPRAIVQYVCDLEDVYH